MVSNKSLDKFNEEIIAALLYDVHKTHGVVFNYRSYRLTLNKVKNRLRQEGNGFLTKTLPRLGKAFDKAISACTPLNAHDVGFASNGKDGKVSKLPRFLGEFFERVLDSDGNLLPDPCARSVAVIRDVCYLFYKYELPYSDEQEQSVIQKFERTEDDLCNVQEKLKETEAALVLCYSNRRRRHRKGDKKTMVEVAREARIRLNRLFQWFDPLDIYPRHGPGVVATKQKLHEKYLWKNVSRSITQVYPLDEYFYTSLSHVCDDLDSFRTIEDESLPAKVILVPKDSRGPRLISCEPVDFQWVQQGLGRAIVRLVESHPITRWNVHFTDQGPNRYGALLGSSTGRYATLDLNEASDRVSLDLVRLLFPSHVFTCLEACRSSSTELPSGKVLPLRKFAPMGSSLCFPVLALTIWAILTAAAPDAYTRKRVLVYGDDVIVPTAFAVDAMEHLESFGLKVNRDKSCISGLFRESCGMDAFKGIDVTPVRLRTVWSSSPSPDVYTSWIEYSNSFYKRKRYFSVYDTIVERLRSIYGRIPGKDMHLACPSLEEVALADRPNRSRVNKDLQKVQYYVWDVKSPKVRKVTKGWSMLLRYFAEVANDRNNATRTDGRFWDVDIDPLPRFSVSQYTSRRTSMLVRRWR